MELKNIDQDFNLVLFKCIEGSASESEMKEVWNWIKHNETNRKYYENMRDIWLSVSNYKPLEENQLEDFWYKFKKRKQLKFNTVNENKPDEPKNFLQRLLRIAAIIIITFALGALLGKYLNKDAPVQSKEFYVVEAPRGAKSFITLADGSKVWLNAGSKISYNLNYNQKNRDIYLEGEAFFEVSKNKKIPFYVHSAGIVVKAIGTAFNVKAYPEEGIVETTLVEGSVSIESTGKSGKKEQILMQPNQKASFYKVAQVVVVEDKSQLEKEEEDITPIPIKAKIDRVELKKEIDTELYTSWKDKRWVFEKQTLEDFAIILERMYDVRVSFKNEELKNYRLSGSFEEENLEQVLKAIQYTVPLEYSIEHNEVTFRINPKAKSKYEKLLNRK